MHLTFMHLSQVFHINEVRNYFFLSIQLQYFKFFMQLLEAFNLNFYHYFILIEIQVLILNVILNGILYEILILIHDWILNGTHVQILYEILGQRCMIFNFHDYKYFFMQFILKHLLISKFQEELIKLNFHHCQYI